MTRTTIETKIRLFSFKLKDHDFNHVFFHKQFSIDENEIFDNILSTVNLKTQLK